MRFLLLIVLLGFSSTAKGQAHVTQNEKLDLYDQVRLSSGEMLSEVVGKLPVKGPYVLTIPISSNQEAEVQGFVSVGSRNHKASQWLVTKDSLTTSAGSNLNFIPIIVVGQETLLVQLTLSEFDKTNPLGVNIVFTPQKLFEKEQQTLVISQAFFLGVFSFLCLFNLLMFLVTKWKMYLLYAVYILSAIVYFLYYFGFLQEVIPVVDRLSINIAYSLYSIIFILYFNFIRELGDYRQTVPKAAFYLKIGIIYKSVQMVLEVIFHLIDINLINIPIYKYTFLVFEIGLMLLIIYNILRAKSFRGRVVIFGSSVLIVAAILAQLNLKMDRVYILEAGILSELLIFSLALGYITKVHFEEKNRNQQLYVEQLELNDRIQKDLEKKLEKKVLDRTRELEDAKSKVDKQNMENVALLNEVHHRVKNNLQMITSILEMQQRRLEKADGKEIITLAKNRVKSIGMVHEQLYKRQNFTNIQINQYIPDLLEMIIQSLFYESKVQVVKEIEALELNAEAGIHIGLILNELVTNSTKYAFHEVKNPQIKLTIQEREDTLVIDYVDNGPGITGENDSKGLGLTVIKTLVEGMSGIMELQTNKTGFGVTITLMEY